MKISERRSHKWIFQWDYLCSVVQILLVINFFRPVHFYFLRFNIIARHTRTHVDTHETRISAHTQSHPHTLSRSHASYKKEFADRSFLTKE